MVLGNGIMDVQLINDCLLDDLHEKAKMNERLRVGLDLRTKPEDNSQRLLNVLEAGTKVAIHRHWDTAETVICIEGSLDEVFYEVDLTAGSEEIADGVEFAPEGYSFKEVARYRLCPQEGKFGIQVPPRLWHTIEVYEPSTIFEGKDGAYRK